MKSSTEFDFSREKHDPNYSTMDERLPKQELAKKRTLLMEEVASMCSLFFLPDQ